MRILENFFSLVHLEESFIEPLVLGITYENRELLYERINKRVDKMLEAGLLGEVEKLIAMGLRNTPTASAAIGYKEFYPYFDGTSTLEECVEKLKTESRRYAKRQQTWFRRNEKICWIDLDNKESTQIFEEAERLCDEFLM